MPRSIGLPLMVTLVRPTPVRLAGVPLYGPSLRPLMVRPYPLALPLPLLVKFAVLKFIFEYARYFRLISKPAGEALPVPLPVTVMLLKFALLSFSKYAPLRTLLRNCVLLTVT